MSKGKTVGKIIAYVLVLLVVVGVIGVIVRFTGGETSFTLTPKGGLTEILQAVYPNYEVGDCRENSYENMYALIVTSYNGKASVKLCFSVLEKVTGVTLDKDTIVF